MFLQKRRLYKTSWGRHDFRHVLLARVCVFYVFTDICMCVRVCFVRKIYVPQRQVKWNYKVNEKETRSSLSLDIKVESNCTFIYLTVSEFLTDSQSILHLLRTYTCITRAYYIGYVCFPNDSFCSYVYNREATFIIEKRKTDSVQTSKPEFVPTPKGSRKQR